MRLATYDFSDEELIGAVDGLLDDETLRSNLDVLGERIRDQEGTRVAADLIEDARAREPLDPGLKSVPGVGFEPTRPFRGKRF